MTETPDIRVSFHLATCFEGLERVSRAAHALVDADIDIQSIGDVQRHTLTELRKFMGDVGVTPEDQDAFIRQMQNSALLPTHGDNRNSLKL